MHDGCAGSFENGQQVIDTIRRMGYGPAPMPVPVDLTCVECGERFQMKTFEDHCPACGMVYGVTPCHAFDPASIMAAGVGY